MRGSSRAGAALTAIAVVLAACGGTGVSRHGEAAKSPTEIAADVVDATKQLDSFRMNGTVTETTGSTRVAAEVAGPGRIGFSEQRGATTVQVLALGAVTYLKASRAYYTAQHNLTPAQVARDADGWLKLSTAAYPSFSADVARTTNLSVELRCWADRKGALSVAGTGRVGGRPAVIVTSDGSVPGSAPGKVWVAATGPAWALRSVITGPRKPRGPAACTQPTTVRASDVTISDFNQPISLAAPPSALDLTH
jgi:hypothetical protein